MSAHGLPSLQNFEEMKQVMVNELRDFLFLEENRECPMNELSRFTNTSTFSPEHFGSRWNELIPILGVATILGSGPEKVLLLKPKHFRIALAEFKKDAKEILTKHGPMSLTDLNLSLFGQDASVEDEWIVEQVNECHPDIILRKDRGRTFVTLT